METQTKTSETTVTKESNDIAHIKLERTARGCRLYVRSEVIENWFAQLGTPVDGAPWQGKSYYQGIPAITFNSDYVVNGTRGWGDRQLGNMMPFLIAVGLKDGVSFDFESTPMDAEAMTARLQHYRRAIISVYQRYIRKFAGEVRITYRETVEQG